MHPTTKSAAVLVAFVAISPALMAPSCYSPSGGSWKPSDIASIPAPRPDPPTGLGPAFGPIAVGGAVTLDDTAELVEPCAAFSLDRLLGGPRLHALADGHCTVKFQTSQGEKTLDYVALTADALQVTPAPATTTAARRAASTPATR